MIPYGHQLIDKDDLAAVIDALQTDSITQGPLVQIFERKLANYCGAKYAVVVSSGTAALHLAYLAADFKKGDQVITSPITFAATSNMLLAVGVKPIFCDININTYNIDEDRIEKLITNKTKAIVPIHLAGQPCEMGEVARLARKYKLLVIEDACHALGAKYKNSKIGSCKYSDMTVFSFHPVKSITTGEGGAILTNNKKYYERLLELRSHGITKDKKKMQKYDGDWYYEMKELGYNYRLTDFQSALGMSQLKKTDVFIKKRKEIADYYKTKLAKNKNIILPQDSEGDQSSWHLFIIRVNKKNHRQFFSKLRQAKIGVQLHYIPIYHHPYYRSNGYKKVNLKNSETYYSTAISLPIFPGLKKVDLDTVINKVLSISNNFKN